MWGIVAIVRYETLEGFVRMSRSGEYREVKGHKAAGLEAQRLVIIEELKN
jgi:hypothetical protein